MSVPSNSMTYYLKGGEIVEARVTSDPADVAVAKLRWLGVQVYKGGDGGVMGQIRIQPLRYAPLPGVRLEVHNRFRVLDGHRLQVLAPSPLSRCRPVPFLDLQSHEQLEHALERSWQEVVAEATQALTYAAALAKDAHLLMEPWRIEGTVRVGQDDVRLLFSARGDRACVCGLNGRALVRQPSNARIILPVRTTAPREEQVGLWRSAIEQARVCVGPEPEAVPEQAELSLDLASQDLESSYGPRVVPQPAAVPPRAPPAQTVPTQVASVARMAPIPRSAPPAPLPQAIPKAPRFAPPPRPPQSAFPPVDLAREDSLDILSLDLSGDLSSGDLPD
ncbi:MAG: hypothetical protein H6730_31670 [Deltaproteobacteria bacterium]|nr:hypothetical protein [Deltaproteobacteria bacterium]